MKKLTKTIIETNLTDIEAYKAINKNDAVSAKEAIGTDFKLKGYVVYLGALTDDETGEVTETTNTVLVTDKGIIGTNSQSLLSSLKDMIENIGDSVYDLDMTITKGVSKSGNQFVDLELL